MALTLWTIGHSTRPLDEFLALLDEYHVQAVADVRRFPGSRRYPQYGSAALAESLAIAKLGYQWFPQLGGRRRALPDSPNTVWRNAAFRGYADHLRSEEFAAGLHDLIEFAQQARTTLMCAELLWWRCHRALIADVLRSRGMNVVHILNATSSVEHPYTAPARVVNGQLTYG